MKLSELFEESRSIEDLVDLLKKHCPYALKDLRPIYRGFAKVPSGFSGFGIIKQPNDVRRSRNTKNYYSLALDNLEEYEDFPKRSKSYICSLSQNKAGAYADFENPDSLLAIFPFAGEKIGVVPTRDIWDAECTSPWGGNRTFIEMNDWLSEMGVDDINWREMLKTTRKMLDKKKFTKMKSEDFYKFVFNPRVTKFECIKSEDLASFADNAFNEVWFDGHAVAMNMDEFKKLQQYLKEKK